MKVFRKKPVLRHELAGQGGRYQEHGQLAIPEGQRSEDIDDRLAVPNADRAE
jgi:hypothetical protein